MQVVFAAELHDDVQFLVVELWLDRSHETRAAADPQSLADLQRLVVVQVPGCDDLVAAAYLISVGRHRSVRS